MAEKDKVDKREHILNAAERVFGEMGYEGASTRHLASEAGVNMAMINYYFGSKDGLLKSVLERRMLIMRNALQEVVAQARDSREKLMGAIDLYINKVSSNNFFHRIIHREISFSQRSELSDFISENVFTNVSTFRDIIREGIENGSFKPVDAEMTVASIFGTIYYIVNSECIASRMMEVDFTDREAVEEKVKPRIKRFLQDYLQVHLIKQ